MNFPLNLTFKRIALKRQLWVTDAAGAFLFYVKTDAFKLRESVTVYADRAHTVPLYEIRMERLLDVNPVFRITTADGGELGRIQKRRLQSAFRVAFDISRGGPSLYHFREDNPWTRVLDIGISQIPIIGAATRFLLSPRYLVNQQGGPTVLRVVKPRTVLRTQFQIARAAEAMPPNDETLVVLATIMCVLIEKNRW